MRLLLFLVLSAFGWTRSEVHVEKNTFDDGFDNWTADNDSWVRMPFLNISKRPDGIQLPAPSGSNETIVIVPAAENRMAIMHKNLTVPDNTDLEVFFSCLALGWKNDNDFSVRLNNPTLQVLYDEVNVFNLDSAITENSNHYSPEKWNQFRLFSSYQHNFTMRLTVMGSAGKTNNSDNLLAIDNIVIKVASNTSRNATKFKPEPEADLQKQDGTWERISFETEEEEDEAAKNGSLKTRPEFCDLLAEPGPCHGSWPRYFYDIETNDCRPFNYGGCNGNENNFHVKVACEAICKKPNKTEDDSIFDILFGPPLVATDAKDEANETRLRDEAKMPQVCNISLSFDDGFEDWNAKYFQLFAYNSPLASSVGITKPSNASSTTGASPTWTHNTIFRRPHLMHAIHLKRGMKLMATFSLKMLGEINPLLHPFFENINPGFKIYVGDFLVFDYILAGELDEDWHTYKIDKSTTSILEFPHLTNRGSSMQIIRIEAWQGNGKKGYIVLDDLSFIQSNTSSRGNPNNSSTTTTTTTTKTSSAATTTTTEKSSSSSTTGTSSSSTSTTTATTTKRSDLPFPCNLQQLAGPCTMGRKRYSFDPDSGVCEPFTYGGCKGNANNFLSNKTCTDQCKAASLEVDVCQMPKSLGQCSSQVQRFYFDMRLKRCIMFFYGGCGGNGNNFESRAKCVEECGGGEDVAKPPRPPPSRPPASKAMRKIGCLLSPPSKQDLKSCINNLGELYFFHNAKSRTCEIEVGCAVEHSDGEVVNQFASRAECENTCIAEGPPPLQFRAKSCLLAPLEGPCRDYSTRYFYDVEQGACSKFAYGGCHGNMNNFRTEKACDRFCGKAELKATLNATEKNSSAVCYLSKDSGRCRGSIRRFFYDPNSKSCRPFSFGGCGGNENRFVSEQDCILRCMPWIARDKVEEEAEAELGREGGSSSTSPLIVAEIVLGTVLVVVFLAAAALAFKYYRIHREKENYRLFSGQQNRDDSLSSLPPNALGMAYDNPVYGDGNEDPEVNTPGPNSFPMNSSQDSNGNGSNVVF